MSDYLKRVARLMEEDRDGNMDHEKRGAGSAKRLQESHGDKCADCDQDVGDDYRGCEDCGTTLCSGCGKKRDNLQLCSKCAAKRDGKTEDEDDHTPLSQGPDTPWADDESGRWGQPSNEERQDKAEAELAYLEERYNNGDDRDNITDFLTNVLHAREGKLDIEGAAKMARMHWDEEAGVSNDDDDDEDDEGLEEAAKRKAPVKGNPYTVVGYYGDNDQPFVAHVKTDSPEAAVKASWGETDSPSDLVVVEVFEGHHQGVLGNEETMTYDFSTLLDVDDEDLGLED